MIVPITPAVPACYGVACERHAECARYAAVEGTSVVPPIATCDDLGAGDRPLFVAVVEEQPC